MRNNLIEKIDFSPFHLRRLKTSIQVRNGIDLNKNPLINVSLLDSISNIVMDYPVLKKRAEGLQKQNFIRENLK